MIQRVVCSEIVYSECLYQELNAVSFFHHKHAKARELSHHCELSSTGVEPGDKERFSAAVQWLGKNLRFDKLEDSPRKFFLSSLFWDSSLIMI